MKERERFTCVRWRRWWRRMRIYKSKRKCFISGRNIRLSLDSGCGVKWRNHGLFINELTDLLINKQIVDIFLSTSNERSRMLRRSARLRRACSTATCTLMLMKIDQIFPLDGRCALVLVAKKSVLVKTEFSISKSFWRLCRKEALVFYPLEISN